MELVKQVTLSKVIKVMQRKAWWPITHKFQDWITQGSEEVFKGRVSISLRLPSSESRGRDLS